MTFVEFEIKGDLRDGLRHVLGDDLRADDPRVLLAVFLKKLADRFGLSEHPDLTHDPLDWTEQDPMLEQLLGILLRAPRRVVADRVRERIYAALVELAGDSKALAILERKNGLTPHELMLTAQVFWNLEASSERTDLPLKPQPGADIPVPGTKLDFATMNATQRANRKVAGKPAGQSFRTRASRLVALVADAIVGSGDFEVSPDLMPEGRYDEEAGDLRAVVWGDNRAASREAPTFVATGGHAEVERIGARPLGPVVIGHLAGVGRHYQPRWIDFEIGHLWDQEGDRRVWVSGPPGAGKSFSARRIMQNAIAARGPQQPVLFVWVDSANEESARAAFAAAGEALRQRGLMAPALRSQSEAEVAHDVLGAMAVSTWPWLVILDNADPDSLIQARLVPPGFNPQGRLLITTNSRSRSMSANGTVLLTPMFTPAESKEFLTSVLGPAATEEEKEGLGETLGRQPLALAIASATIDAHRMTATEWLQEFERSASMDTAGDEKDDGGYPHLIAEAWKAALRQAANDLPAEVVERAALVAALQDPDGHPTWLWESATLRRWIAGEDDPIRVGRRPAVLQRLIDHQLVDIRGEKWAHSHVTIHRLAARAIREVAAPETLDRAAELLAWEWLKRLSTATNNRAEMNKHMRALISHPFVNETTRTIAALLGRTSEPTALQDVVWKVNSVRNIAEELLAAGASGTVTWADYWTDCAEALQAANISTEALAQHGLPLPEQMRREALRSLQSMLADSMLTAGLQGHALALAARLNESCGELVTARDQREQALVHYDRAAADGGSIEWLKERAELLLEMGRSAADTELVERIMLELPEAATDLDGEALVFRDRIGSAAGFLNSIGHQEDAARLYETAFEDARQRADLNRLDLNDVESACKLAVQTGRLADALKWATTARDLPLTSEAQALLLASVHMHSGDRESALDVLHSLPGQNWPVPPDQFEDLDLRGMCLQLPTSEPPGSDFPEDARHFNQLSQKMLNQRQQKRLVQAYELALRSERFADAARLRTAMLTRTEQAAEDGGTDGSLRRCQERIVIALHWSQAGEPAEGLPLLVDAVRSLEILRLVAPDQEVEKARRRGVLFLGMALAALDRHSETVALIRDSEVLPGKGHDEGDGDLETAHMLYHAYLRSALAAGDPSAAGVAAAELLAWSRAHAVGAGAADGAGSWRIDASLFPQVLALLDREGLSDEALQLADEFIAFAQADLDRSPTPDRLDLLFVATLLLCLSLARADLLPELAVALEQASARAEAAVAGALEAQTPLASVESVPQLLREVVAETNADRIGLGNHIRGVADRLERVIAEAGNKP